MDTKRIVITGGPGSGKTSLINFLEQQGHCVIQEISRDVIREAQEQGIEQLFLENPILFSEKLLEGRLNQFLEGDGCPSKVLFYDRGMPDVTGYMDFAEIDYPEKFSNTCMSYQYDAIFVLPPWEAIYQKDNERYESFEQAEKLYHFLKKSYEGYGYNVNEVPVGSISERVHHILNSLKNLY